MDNTMAAKACTTLLQKLRREQCEWHQQALEERLKDIIGHKSEFPLKIRHCIDSVSESWKSNPQQSWATLQKIIKEFFLGTIKVRFNNVSDMGVQQWGGLDCEIDMEREVEIAIRVFPFVLKETMGKNTDCNPIFRATTSLKALPFTPLLAELARELGVFAENVQPFLVFNLLNNIPFLFQNPRYYSEEFHREIDEKFLSVLIRVTEKDLIRKEEVHSFCINTDFLYENPSLIKRRVRYILNWDPSFIKKDGEKEILLHRYVGSWDSERKPTFEMFRTIFELGMFHYPEDIGFMFHSYDFAENTCFEIACETFGKGKVKKMVDEIILQHSDQIYELVRKAASNKAIHPEGLNTLTRLHAKVEAKSRSKSKSRKRGSEKMA